MSLNKVVRILPVDDRPCHNDHINLAMKYVEGVEIEIAPSDILGHFTHSGNTDLMAEFLRQGIQNVDTLIVSLDALCYGGLIQGRTHSDEENEVYIKRLDVLKELKEKHPNLRIYAYSVIMRLTTTVTDTSQLSVWEDLFEYSQLVNKVKTHPVLQINLDEVKSRLPQESLDDYLKTRKRNHLVNKELVELVINDVIDYGVLVQEDTSEYGLHLEEQAMLNQMIVNYGVKDKIVMKNGTDEMVALFVAKAIVKDTVVKIDKDLIKEGFIAPYEDHLLIDNLEKSLSIAGVGIDQDAKEILYVIAPLDRTYDLAFEDVSDLNLLETQGHKLAYDADVNQVYVLDVSYANGGDIRNLEYVISDYDASILKAYSAWNTASNAIGSLVLDIVIAQEYIVNEDYLKMRIIDDALYQGQVRGKLNEYLKAIGQDIWGEVYSDEANVWVSQKLNEASQKYVLTQGIEVEACLPWGRTFELRLEKK